MKMGPVRVYLCLMDTGVSILVVGIRIESLNVWLLAKTGLDITLPHTKLKFRT